MLQEVPFRMDSPFLTPERLLHWFNLAYMTALAATVLLSFGIYRYSKQVTDAKDRELKRYQTESEVKIATAQAESAKAMEIAEAEKLARAELESQVAVAQARAAEANLAASQAQLELAKLKEPRTVAPEDQETIIDELEKFTGQNYSFSVFQDPEPLALLRVIDAILKSAGWVRVESRIGTGAVTVAGGTASVTLTSGVFLTLGPNDPASLNALRALQAALSAAGISCRMSTDPPELRDKPPDTILIVVGKKL